MNLPFLTTLWLASLMVCQGASPKSPNVVLILSNDLGYAVLGLQGCEDIPTPNLDRLRAAGYTTALVGKWHLGDKEGFTPMDRGFDEFFGFTGGGHFYLPKADAKGEYAAPLWRNREPVQESRYLTDAFGEEAAAFIGRQRGATKPFFLYLAFNAVHPPLPAKENDERRFADITDPNSLLADGYPEKPDASDRCHPDRRPDRFPGERPAHDHQTQMRPRPQP